METITIEKIYTKKNAFKRLMYLYNINNGFNSKEAQKLIDFVGLREIIGTPSKNLQILIDATN